MKKLTLLLILIYSITYSQKGIYLDLEMGYPFIENPPPGTKLSVNYGAAHYFNLRETKVGVKFGYYTVQITGSDLESLDLQAAYIPFERFEISSGVNRSFINNYNLVIELKYAIPINKYLELTTSATNVFIKTRNVVSIQAGIRIKFIGKELFAKRMKGVRFF